MNQKSFIFTTADIKYKDTFLSGLRELQDEGKYLEYDINELQNNFEKFVEKLNNESKGIDLKPGWVPATKYWLIVDGVFAGQVAIRHKLNENLLKMGGHIGYYVVPSQRKKGYGTELLKYALEKSKEMGFDKVLLTCDETNIGSRKIIEKCGGILENIIPADEKNPPKCRFWIKVV